MTLVTPPRCGAIPKDMHELSICGSIAGIVTRRAEGRSVDTIHLRIGQLRQIVPDTLVYCWPMATAATALEGSRLEVEYVPVRIECHGCGQATEIGDFPILLCARCDSADVEVIAGEEFLVTALELAKV
jgi:hydrogenase nickel incorporation protein HypA/HybF